MAFHESSHFAIQESQFTNIQGSQYSYIQGHLVQYPQPAKQKSTIWDEYATVPRGKIYIKKTLGVTYLGGYDPKTGCWRNLNAYRTINIARIHGEDKDSEFLHLVYSGPDAFTAYEEDFKQSSCVQDDSTIQLFGYNCWHERPALLFYEAHIPVSYVCERSGSSSLLLTYFQYLFGKAPIASDTVLLSELWIDAGAGTLRKGPYVQDLSNILRFARGLSADRGADHSVLTLQTYGNPNDIFLYLTQVLSIRDLFQGLCWSHNVAWKWVDDNYDTAYMLSSLPGTVYRRHCRTVIARWPDISWYFQLREDLCGLPEVMRKTVVIMSDGSVRFTFANTRSFPSCFYLFYGLRVFSNGEASRMAYYWLLQAHSISSQIGIKEDEWEQLSTLGYFFLEFRSRRDADACRDMPTLNRPMYLVVEPIPRASDDENKRKAWARGKKYYWCFDPLGAEEVTEDVQLSLGLPSLTCKIMLDNRYWKRDTYDAVQMLHTYNGFNPLSTCLAQSFQFPVLEIVKEVEGPPTEDFGKSTGMKLDGGVDDMLID